MYYNQTIRKITAGLMLLLFALSVTPKQLLHDVITGHKHNAVKSDAVVNIHTSKKSLQCNWHNDAIESPFTDQPGVEVDYPLPLYASHIVFNTSDFYSTDHFFATLRGPPALA